MRRGKSPASAGHAGQLTRRAAAGAIASAGLIAATGLTLGSAIQAPPASAAIKNGNYDLVPRQVADGVWFVEGAREYFTQDNGGDIVNCVLIETDAGMVIIDTGVSLKYGQALRQAAASLSGLGIAASFNTHHHPDHWFGNQVFADRPIYALGETASLARAEGDGFSDGMYRLLGNWMRGTETTPPTQTITSSSITIGGRIFVLYPLSGHTGADLALLDKKTGTLITGDLAFYERAPTTPHADLPKWYEALDALAAVEAALIIPGHGPEDRDGQSLEQTRTYLTWLETGLKQAAAEGLDMVEIMEETLLPDAFKNLGAMPQEFHRSVSHLYPAIERQAMPLSNL
ncbi:MAG: quinoprotein relay system zinc metallohydrolase 1 [Ahrensia sp.]|nr:quinoprotein relay system zinc metallohydrolase 1 [Ahrensia sp.]